MAQSKPPNQEILTTVKTKDQKRKRNPLNIHYKNLVGQQLDKAFRKGLNLNVRGFHRAAPSDHLPIQVVVRIQQNIPATVPRQSFEQVNSVRVAENIISWNLLADTHLGNNYRNIHAYNTISKDFADNNTFKKRAHWLLSYLGEYIVEANKENDIIIDENTLRGFPDLFDFSKERDIEKARAGAREIIETYLDGSHEQKRMLIESAGHATEMYHAINYGYLKWENRLKLIKEDKQPLIPCQKILFFAFKNVQTLMTCLIF